MAETYATADELFNLDRFVAAQAPVYETVVRELRMGRKRAHWMWFIFPQLRDLGRSSTAQFFGIAAFGEAQAYVAHPQLGTRLVACVKTMLGLSGRSLNAILGTPDDLKFRSSMTLFDAAVRTSANVFDEALGRYCDGIADDRTLALLEREAQQANLR